MRFLSTGWRAPGQARGKHRLHFFLSSRLAGRAQQEHKPSVHTPSLVQSYLLTAVCPHTSTYSPRLSAAFLPSLRPPVVWIRSCMHGKRERERCCRRSDGAQIACRFRFFPLSLSSVESAVYVQFDILLFILSCFSPFLLLGFVLCRSSLLKSTPGLALPFFHTALQTVSFFFFFF